MYRLVDVQAALRSGAEGAISVRLVSRLCDDNSEGWSLCQFSPARRQPRAPACQEASHSLIRLFAAEMTLSSNLGEHSA